MLENASLTSENTDQSQVPELTVWRRIARSLKQLGVQHSSVAIAALYNRTQSAEYVCHVHSLCACCHLLVQPAKPNSDSCTKMEYK